MNNSGFIFKFAKNLEDAYGAYEKQLIKSFDSLPAKGTFHELKRRVATVALTPLLMPILGSGYLIGRWIINYQIPGIALKLNKKITDIEKANLPGWQKQAIKQVCKSRFDNPAHELRRLQARKILTPKLESQLENAITAVDPSLTFEYLRKRQIKVIMGQALEIKSIYGKTHDVFIHAQGSNWLGLNYLVKELHRLFQPEDDISHFKFLRPPCKLAQRGTASTIWKTFRNTFLGDENITNVKEYINSKWFVFDSDGETREHLLSTDAYFLNPQKWESSLFFLINNSNILGKTETIKYFYKKIIQHYRPNLDETSLSILAHRIFYATKDAKDVCGNLFTICLPKEESHNIQYRAHPFGPVCKCHPEDESVKILSKLQKEFFGESTKCSSFSGCEIPQFRLYTPRLNPQDTPIYLLTPNQKASRKQMKLKIKNIASEIYSK